jgi:hypothetical protein
LTPEAQERICEALEKGLPRHVAATLGGVSYKAMRMWERKGAKQKRGGYRDFVLAVEAAEAEAVKFYVGILKKAAKPHTERTEVVKTGDAGFTQTTEKRGVFDWRAALAILERRWSSDWAIKESAAIAKLEAQVAELRKAIKGDGK